MTRPLSRRLLTLALASALALPAWAQSAFAPFTVSDIRIEGLQRIGAGTVFTYLPVERGDTLDSARAAEAMRRTLIDSARRKRAAKHGGNAEHVNAAEIEIAVPAGKDDEMLAVHEALDALSVHDLRKAEQVKLRYFVGLTIEEAAEILGISVPTAKRDWTYAKAWLYRAIKQAEA